MSFKVTFNDKDRKIIDDHNLKNLTSENAYRKLENKLKVISRKITKFGVKKDMLDILSLLSDINVLYSYEELQQNNLISRSIKKTIISVDELFSNRFFNNNCRNIEKYRYELDKLRCNFEITQINKREKTIEEILDIIIFERNNITQLEIILDSFHNGTEFSTQLYQKIIMRILQEKEKHIRDFLQTELPEKHQKIMFYEKALDKIVNYKDRSLLNEELIKQLEEFLESKKTLYGETITKKDDYRNFLNGTKSIINQRTKTTPEDDLKRYNLNYKNLKVTKKTKELIDNHLKLSLKKKDITSEFAITIDGKNTKIRDDAFTIRRLPDNSYLIGLHIADVLSVIPYNHEIILNTLKYPSAVYTKNRKIDMLPTKIITDYLSLDENKLRPVVSYYLKVSPLGIFYNKVIIEENMLKVSKNLSYQEATKIINNPTNDPLSNNLKMLKEVNSLITKYSKFDPLYDLLKKNKKFSTGLAIEDNSVSGNIVENLILHAHNLVAKMAFNREIPFIYRNHDVNSSNLYLDDKEKKSLEIMNQKDLLNYISNIYPSASYSMSNSGHDGLRLKHYSHISSPLRRAVDIGTTLSIKKNVLKTIDISDDELNDFLEEVTKSSNIYNQNINQLNKQYYKEKK